MSKKRNYGIRYSVEEWNKPPENVAEKVAPGITVSNDNYGYTDDIVVVSILKDEFGEIGSMALFSNLMRDKKIPKDVLERLKEEVEHYIKHHSC